MSVGFGGTTKAEEGTVADGAARSKGKGSKQKSREAKMAPGIVSQVVDSEHAGESEEVGAETGACLLIITSGFSFSITLVI